MLASKAFDIIDLQFVVTIVQARKIILRPLRVCSRTAHLELFSAPMHEFHLLTNGIAIFGVGLIVAWMFRLLGAPSIIGFLFAGLVIGPSGLAWVSQEDVEVLSELGLILLLFIIGLELSPELLLHMGRSLLVAAAIQVGATVALVAALGLGLFGLDVQGSVILGIIVTLSSTAIVLKQISDRGEADTPTGRMTTGILIIQDILVITVILCLPFLAFGAQGEWRERITPSVIGLAGLTAMLIFGRRFLAAFVKKVVYPGGAEFVTLFAVVAAFGGAWLAGLVGWSLPLGACIVGLLLAEADVRHQIASDVLPLRDVFNALFFISLGMLVDVDIALSHAAFLGGAIALTLLGKSFVTAFAVRASGWSVAASIQIGIGLCTVSEFGYVLAREANHLELLPDETFTLVTVYALGTMFFGAMLVPIARPLSLRLASIIDRDSGGKQETAPTGDRPHIILCGYGTNGQNLARVLKATHIPFEIIEIDPRLVKLAADHGHRVTMGDASRGIIQHHAGIERARGVAIAINDFEATARVIAKVRSVRPDVYILADTLRITHIDSLYKLGATEVLAQDFETSIELAAHILKRMDVPNNIITGQLALLRSGHYSMLRGMPADRQTSDDLMRAFHLTATHTHYVESTSPAAGSTLKRLNLRAETGATIIAVVRNGNPSTNPGAEFVLESGDVLVLVGAHEQIEKATALLDGER